MIDPKYRITGKIAKAMMSIEADRQIVATLPLTVPMLDSRSKQTACRLAA